VDVIVKVINDLLEYEGLKIVQDSEFFKFSLDSVLLANFIKINKKDNNLLDIGTGNAPIPLILAKKTELLIHGVEIQKESFILAKESVKINSLEDRIKLFNQDIKAYSNNLESDVYDLITCNPPYFRSNDNKRINKNITKATARHELSLGIDDIFRVARKLLKNNGKIAIVHRPERLVEIITSMKENNIEPKRILFVYPYKGKEANILLIEGTKNGKPGIKILDSLYVHNKNDGYTDEVKKIFK
jgi:Predicted O-methyltransferase